MPVPAQDLPAVDLDAAGLDPSLDCDAETRRVEAELLRTREDPQSRNFELLSVLVNLRQPALVIDGDDVIAFRNPAAVRLFGSDGPPRPACLAEIPPNGAARRVEVVDVGGRTRDLDARAMPVRWGENRARIVLLRPCRSPRARPHVDELTARSAAVGRLRAARAAIESGIDRLRGHAEAPVIETSMASLRAVIERLDQVSEMLDAIETDPSGEQPS